MLEEIKKETVKYVESHSSEVDKIKECFDKSGELKNEEMLFKFFISAAKEGKYCLVNYILSSFSNADTRAEFGNKQDDLGNTAYHYAAQYGHTKIIFILNNKEHVYGKPKFIRFVIENKAGEKPLDVCCRSGNYEAFKAIWSRAGKTNHNPSHALPYAYEGGSKEIINALEKHPKVKSHLSRKKESKEQEGKKESKPIEEASKIKKTSLTDVVKNKKIFFSSITMSSSLESVKKAKTEEENIDKSLSAASLPAKETIESSEEKQPDDSKTAIANLSLKA